MERIALNFIFLTVLVLYRNTIDFIYYSYILPHSELVFILYSYSYALLLNLLLNIIKNTKMNKI